MEASDLLKKLLGVEKIEEVEQALKEYKNEHMSALQEIPFGKRPNNRGAIEVASDAGRSVIERITNAVDALLELEYATHKGTPDCRSPREAASAWLSVPLDKGLAGLSVKERQNLADRVILQLEPGEGAQSRVLTIIDKGTGISQSDMENTILSLNESNKIQKHYLVGTYGQGGSSTFAFCRYTLIASKLYESNEIGFTVVWYLDLPADQFKTGQYLYLTENNKPLLAKVEDLGDSWEIEHGTVIRHFGYDLSNYSYAIGPRSLYGVLQRVLFDPITPLWFQNKVNDWNRVIKGSRNALNGAIDSGDDSKGPELDHHVPMFNVSLGDYGCIGIEYWVLKKDDKKKNPADAYVDSRKPIILSHNGQNQGELSSNLYRKEADLPFLRNLFISNVNCDRLTPMAKRNLFSSTREQSREGQVLRLIQDELINLLKSDDELKRLNKEAQEKSLQDQDETAEKQVRRQVMRLLNIYGVGTDEAAGKETKEPGEPGGRPVHPHHPVKPAAIELQEPPTYIRIIWDEEKDITFYANQRRYIRIETDANSSYHDPNKRSASKINIVVGADLKIFGTSPLQNGRMRIGLECNNTVVIDSKASIRIELYRPGLPTLNDEKDYVIVPPPVIKEKEKPSKFPNIKLVPVNGPDDEQWQYICNYEDTDYRKYAYNTVMSEGTLFVYYSTVYPRFEADYKRFEVQSPAMAQSFKRRYEIWLVVHSLLMQQDFEAMSLSNGDLFDEMARQERCRLATIAAIVANNEIKSGVNIEDINGN